MARKKLAEGEVNKSAEIRRVLALNPKQKASEVVDALAKEGITVQTSLVYIVKGKVSGSKKRPTPVAGDAGEKTAAVTAKNGSALSVVLKVKQVATEVGGMKALKSLVEALSN